MMELAEQRWIEGRDISFSVDRAGLAARMRNGREDRVTACRLFPMTLPDRCIAIRDSRGQEWGVLRELSGLDEASRAALERELRIRQFLPRIERIIAIRRRGGQWRWEVATDCGGTQFRTGPLYESTVVLPNGSRLVVDIADQKYLLPDEGTMEASSRKLLARWL